MCDKVEEWIEYLFLFDLLRIVIDKLSVRFDNLDNRIKKNLVILL